MENTINSILLWTAPKIIQDAIEGDFNFDWWNLNNGNNIRVVESNHDDIGKIDFETYKIPLSDGWWVLWKYYREKEIRLIVCLRAWNPESFNDLIEELKYRTDKTEGKLKIIINWLVRERTATRTSLKFNRKHYNNTWIWNVELVFTCVNPFSQLEDPDATNIISQTGSYQSNVIYEGRAPTYPKLVLTMDSWTSAWMRFELNGYVIQINTTLNANDVVVFDGTTKTVSVNDVEVVYSWVFTPLNYGENIYSIHNDWEYSGSLSYFTKYL